MSLTANALISVADFMLFMGWPPESHAEDIPVVEMVIEGVSASFSNYADADFKSATYTSVKLDGTGKTYLFLPHFPVTTFTSLYEDDTLLVKDTDYWVDTDLGILYRIITNWPSSESVGRWTSARQGLTVTYAAGYATVPPDVKMACLLEVGRAYEMVKNHMFGETSRTVEGVSISLSTDELLLSTLAVLGRYSRTQI